MHIGRYQLGDRVPVWVQCRDSSQAVASPDAAVAMKIFDASATKIEDRSIPLKRTQGRLTGFFEFLQLLDGDYSTGKYFLHLTWETESGAHSDAIVRTFEVISGGNAKGGYNSLFVYQPPHAVFVVGQTDGGDLETRKNPQV